MPLPVTLIWSSHLSNFSQAHSLKHSPLCFTFTIAGLTHPQRLRYWSSMSPTHQPSQAADQPQTHTAIRLRSTGKAMRSKPRERCSVIRNQSISEDVDSVGSINAWVCLRLVILFGLDWGKRLRIFVVVDVCAVLGVGCYVWLPRNSKKIWKVCVDILFYCDVYIILLHWKLKQIHCCSMWIGKIDKVTFYGAK